MFVRFMTALGVGVCLLASFGCRCVGPGYCDVGSMCSTGSCGIAATGCGGCGGGGCAECPGGTRVGSFDSGSCNSGCNAAWSAPQFFVDDCGNPCFGPLMGLANSIRNAYMGCGCGPMYVDEWMSDPPDCHDPCDAGCYGSAPCQAAFLERGFAQRKARWATGSPREGGTCQGGNCQGGTCEGAAGGHAGSCGECASCSPTPPANRHGTTPNTAFWGVQQHASASRSSHSGTRAATPRSPAVGRAKSAASWLQQASWFD